MLHQKNMSAFGYNADIVICVDTSKSMLPFLNEIKANACSIYEKLLDEMEVQDPPKSIQQVRIKIIAFGNSSTKLGSVLESQFYTLPRENDEFCKFVNSLEVSNCSQGYSNSLEALALAIKSDWGHIAAVRRHVIIIYTDASALPLGARAGQTGYPADMPKDLAELMKWWEGRYMEKRAKRLLVFAPDVAPWSDMADWTNVLHIASKAGVGCDDTDVQTCIHLLVQSL